VTSDSDAPLREGRAGPSGERAGFGRRFGALLVDLVLLTVVNVVILRLFGDDVTLYSSLSSLVAIAYFAALEGGRGGQTLGKRALGIRVADFRTGSPIGVGRAALRYVARILSSLPLFLGYFWMLWDRESQTWHDKLTSTVVVPASPRP
jgi:uncharacterized RDD family membrane protein YckC